MTADKESACGAGDTEDTSSIPGSRRSPGEGNGNPLQFSYLENSMDRGVWWATIQEVTVGQFSSVAQSCPTLCNLMDCSTPGFPVHHQFPELTQTHVHRVGDAIQPTHPLLSSSRPAFNLSQHQGLQMSQFFTSGRQSIGISASISLPPMNIQD